MNLPTNWQTYFNRRLLAVMLLGFSSGLPMALTGTALQAWFTISGISIIHIGFLALLGQPYVFKFLWAPFLDRFALPFLGRRRGWIACMQVAIAVMIFLMSSQNPLLHPVFLALMGLLLALFSATQDIAFNAYQTEILHEKERGLGAAYGVSGYRIAMLISGAFSFVLADNVGWQTTYEIMAAFMLVGACGVLIAPESKNSSYIPKSLKAAIVEPLAEFLSRDSAKLLLLLIVLYKLSDAFALTLSSTFFIRGLGFTQTEVGLMMKGVGLAASIIGVLLGGSLMLRMGLYFSLFWFGLLQAISNLAFMVLAMCGKSLVMMGVAIFIEQACSGMGTAAFVAFLMSLCDKRYTATQYALLSALAAIGRVFVGPLAGIMVAHIGWAQFYLWSFIIALPSLGLLWVLRGRVNPPLQEIESER
ncbi:MAG: MFS transporter [Gammaproteobacteria bacterium]|nr:MFS transporter [Gammaproteobacteria bacterium]